MAKSYKQKLLDPRWQRKRIEILNRDNFTCRLCNDDKSTLHVHHKKYKSVSSPWEYENDELITYCSTCHEIVEFAKSEGVKHFLYSEISTNVPDLRVYSFLTTEDNGEKIVFVISKQGDTIKRILTISEKYLLRMNKILKNGKRQLLVQA